MEASPLPLVTWIAAIREVGMNHQISATDLSQRIKIRRLATVRSMLKVIRQALETGEMALFGT